jgi:hypothetical protein
MLRQQPSLGLSITVSAETLIGVRRSIHACESCSPNAQVSVQELLNRFTGHFTSEREYMWTEDLLCPWCAAPIDNETLVEVQNIAKASAARACA